MSIKSIAQNRYVVGEILTTLKGWHCFDDLWRYVKTSDNDDIVVFVDFIDHNGYNWIVGIDKDGMIVRIAPFAIKNYLKSSTEFERS